MFKPRAHLVRAFLWLLTLASVVFVVHFGWSIDLSGVSQIFHGIHWGYFLVASLLSVAHVVVCGRIFSAALDQKAGSGVLPIFVISQVAKYVPGRIWGVVMQKALIGADAPTMHVLSANGRVTVTVVASQLLVVAVLGGLFGWVTPVVALFAVSACLASGALMAFAARQTGWSLLAAWRSSRVARSSAMYVVLSAVVTVAGWMVLYSAALGLDGKDALEIVAVSAGSFLVGLASVLPAGLGTRDAAYIVFGSAPRLSLDLALLPALAIVSRIWLLATDVLCSLVGFLWLILLRRKQT